mgnify:CR=1 FL=1
MAIKIGITGGIGSGKSMVSRLLEVLGVPVYISDLETKRLMASDSLIREELSALLGAEVYAGDTLNIFSAVRSMPKKSTVLCILV